MKKLPFDKTDLMTGIVVAGLFIILSFFSLPVFEALERVLYGIEMRLDLPRSMGPNRIAIVNIDDKSIKQLGPWPWPRSIIADMITILKGNGAKIIGLDMVFSNKEQNQGLKEVENLHQELLKRGTSDRDEWLLKRLKEIGERLDNDRLLVQATKESGNLIFPVVGTFGRYDTELVLSDDAYLEKSTLDIPEMKTMLKNYVSVNELATPYPELARNCLGVGHLNLSPYESAGGRVHLLFINYRGHILPSMSLRVALEYLGKNPADVIYQGKEIRLSGPIVPTQKGEIFIKFKGGRRSFPYYSFADILNVKKVPAVFDNKIVLIGYTAEGAVSLDTPVDPRMPRVELTANVIEGLMNGRFLKRPDGMIFAEGLIILFLCLSACLALPRLDVMNRLAASVFLLLLALLLGIISFMALDIWLKTVYMLLALMTLFVVTTVRAFFIHQKALVSRESIETNRMLGLSFQSQGLLDLAFEKFRKCPLDDAMKDVVYNLGLDYERKRMLNKAVAVYEYITQRDPRFRDLGKRMPRLVDLVGSLAIGTYDRKKDEKIVVAGDMEIKPTVGRYEVLEEIGQGAMGVVYKARDPKIHRLVAIKTIRFSDDFEEAKVQEVKSRFFREAEIAGKLSHPSIVAIYDVGEDYDLTYLAMEYLEGENLQAYTSKGSLLPLRKVLQIIRETAEALDYAHQNGVVHRDIKPANIMLLKSGRAKVTDFGIAKAVSSSQTKSGVILGTPNYMSPEQINGKELDGRSDIFSLGVVFFELLTGQLPFQGRNLTHLLYQITQVKPPSPREINPKVPKPVDQIISKILTKNPDNRFQSAGELAKYLKATIAKMDQIMARAKA